MLHAQDTRIPTCWGGRSRDARDDDDEEDDEAVACCCKGVVAARFRLLLRGTREEREVRDSDTEI